MGVAGDNEVDAVHLFGQLLILRLALLNVSAAVGQADNKLGALLLQSLHTPLGSLNGVLQGKTGGGGAVIGVGAHQTENAVGDTAPFQEHIVLHPVGRHRPLDIQLVRVIIGELVVCHEQSRHRIPAGAGGGKHPGKTQSLVVKLVVSGGGGVIAQGSHGTQLRRF